MAVARWCAAGVTILAVAAIAGSALPTLPSGKPGLYEFRASDNGAIFRAKGAADLPEKELQRLADESLSRWTPSFQFCVSKEGSTLFNPTSMMDPHCTYANVVTTKGGYSADVTCPVYQRMDLVHLTVETEAPEHQIVTMRMLVPGTSLSMITRYEIAWLSPDCGDIPPGGRRTAGGKIVVPANP